MLPKSKRLNLRHDFKSIAAGKKIETPNFKFFYLFRAETTNINPLVGISLSKKHFKEAHDRNKARRFSSRVIEKLYNSLPSSLNLVIMPKTPILDQSEQSLIKEVSDVVLNIKNN